MSLLLHQRLLNEATQYGTAEVLRHSPAEYSPELEQAIRQGVRQAILYYADALESVDRRLHPLDQAGRARA
ncbi:MAG TPA: hypothetical protein VMF69_11205 [Gemmataceae bacterium]|nr:hypothetical protein [Gemmataceae bacterium]